MRIENIDKNDKNLVRLTFKDGQQMILNWLEFWDICNQGEKFDVFGEVADYLADLENENIKGISCNEIREDKQLLDDIVQRVIDRRSEIKNTDDIYNAIENCL